MISALSFCFSVLGTPEEIICDNGTQFTRKGYKKFADKWGFTMTTSSPHYPRGHSFIERQVQIIKKLFNTCDKHGTIHQVALQQLRAILLDSNIPSQQSFSMPDRSKQLCQTSSNFHRNMKHSGHPCNPGRTPAGMMLKPRRDPLSYIPNLFGYKTPPATDEVKMWLSPKLRHPYHILWRHHKVNTERIGYT